MKSARLTFNQTINTASAEVSGPGIAEAEFAICSSDGKKFLFVASPNSATTLENQAGQPLSKG